MQKLRPRDGQPLAQGHTAMGRTHSPSLLCGHCAGPSARQWDVPR